MPAPAVMTALMQSLGGLSEGAKGVANGLGMIKGAATQVSGMFNQLAGTLRPFVEAFSPAAVEVFDAAIRDLSAVIGSAALPVFGVLTAAVKEFSSILLPAIEELRPVIQAVANSFRTLVSGALANFEILVAPLTDLAALAGDVVVALTPLLRTITALNSVILAVVSANLQSLIGVLSLSLEMLSPIFEMIGALAEPLRALSVIIQGLTAGLRSLLSGLLGMFDFDMSEFVDEFKKSMRELSLAAIVAAAALARIMGAESIVEGMKRALGAARKDATGYAAPKDARISQDINAFAREIGSLAALASKDGVKDARDEEKEWRSQALAALNRIPTKSELAKEIAHALEPHLIEAAKVAANIIRGPIYEVAGDAAALAGGVPGLIARGLRGRR